MAEILVNLRIGMLKET